MFLKAQNTTQQNEIIKILCFNPEIKPDIPEIKILTNSAYFSVIQNKIANQKNRKILKTNNSLKFDSITPMMIKEYCFNNNTQFALIPKIRYFKVGIGKYVFSNQVVISMKLFNNEGSLLTETHYNTYKKKMRLIGSTENFIKIGTKGAIKNIIKQLKKETI